jgi:predicted  nucleic acid-binding Zn-ribbon protein
MTIEELEKLVSGLKSDLTETKKALDEKAKELEGLQSLKGKWSNEVGDLRKKVEDFEGREKSLNDKLESAVKELDALKAAKATTREDNHSSSQKPSVTDQAATLESSLTEDERKKVEEFVKALDPEKRKSFVEDDAVRVAVFEEVKAGKPATEDPDSIWKVKKPAPSGDVADQIRKLMKQSLAGNLVAEERGGLGMKTRVEQKHRTFF